VAGDCCNFARVAETTRRIDVPATRNRWFARCSRVQNPYLRGSPTGEFMMLKTTRALRASRRLKADFDVEIAGVATAVPRHTLPQADAARRAKHLFPGLADYEALFRNTGIETRFRDRCPAGQEQSRMLVVLDGREPAVSTVSERRLTAVGNVARCDACAERYRRNPVQAFSAISFRSSPRISLRNRINPSASPFR